MNQKQLIISVLSYISLTFISPSVFGQIFSSSQNPLSVKWREINTKGFKIIYDEKMEIEAQRIALTLPRISDSLTIGKPGKLTTIPIVLQNQGTIANGFVQLAPKKSEFFTTPPQDFDSQDWLNNLSIHEVRHVKQFDKLTYNQQNIFPQMWYFTYLGLSIPTWFFEGDAVYEETTLTQSGRGRQPEWVMPYRTSILSNTKLSYSQAYFGSSRVMTPGYYQLGYHNVAYLNNISNEKVSDSLIVDISRRPIRLYPFSKSLKKRTGLTPKKLFSEVKTDLQKKWNIQLEKSNSEDYEILVENSKIPTQYFLATSTENDKILALKESVKKARHFVLIDSQKKEKELFKIGYQEQPWFSYQNQLLVWDEIHQDLRYKNRNYSVIYIYDFTTKKIKQLTQKTRLFSPSLSPDGSKIIAVKVGLNNQFNLVEINTKNGEEIKQHSNHENYTLQNPSFDASGTKITYISVSEKGKSLNLIQGSENTVLFGNTRQQINRPIFTKNGIAFNAHFNGTNNLYNYNFESQKITALTQSKFGAFNFHQNENQEIIFSDYQLNGLRIAKTNFEEKEIGNNEFVNYFQSNIKDNSSTNVFENIKVNDTAFSSKPYTGFKNLFNFHSIVPVVENEYNYGLQLLSDNLLNTFSSQLGAKYKSDLKDFEYSASVQYKSLYPVVNLIYRNRPRRTFYNQQGNMTQGDWREHFAKLYLSLPLSFNDRNTTHNFHLNFGTSFTQRYQLKNMPNNFIRQQVLPLEYNFTYFKTSRTSVRDISPRWAQRISLSYFNQPFDKTFKGELLALETAFYFPGLFSNHSFVASFNYQKAIGANRFAIEIPTVYGYNNIIATNTLKNTLLLNYRLPIAFPEWELGALAYIRNFRATTFVHYENIGINSNFNKPKTYGFGINTSLNLLRYQPVIDFGARLVFVNKNYNQNPILEFSFNYNL